MAKKVNVWRDFVQTPLEGKYAAVYIRVSNDDTKGRGNKDEAIKQSIEVQREECIEYCEARSWKLKIYDRDNDLSGFYPPNEEYGRPDFARLVKDIKNGHIHTIVVQESKRLARSPQVMEDLLENVLIPYGTNLVGTLAQIDITTEDGRYYLRNETNQSRKSVAQLRTKSMKARDRAAKSGVLAQSPQTFGYRSKGRKAVEKAPEEADIVIKVFDLFVNERRSITWIFRWLDSSNIPTKRRGQWHRSTVRRMLQNSRYIGKLKYKGQEYDSPFEPIIDKSTWDKAQVLLGDNASSRKKTTSRHLLSGLLKCGACWRHNVQSQESDFRRENMVVYNNHEHLYYACQQKRIFGAKTCDGTRTTISKEEIEDAVSNLLATASAATFHSMVKREDDSEQIKISLTQSRDKLSQLVSKEHHFITKYATGRSRITDAQYEMTLNEYEKQRQDLTISIAEQGQLLEERSTKSFVESRSRFTMWDSLTFEDKRLALQSIIDMIVLYDDRVELCLRVNKLSKNEYLPLVIPRNVVKPRGTIGRLPDTKLWASVGAWEENE